MVGDSLLSRARQMWEHLAGGAVRFPVAGIEVVASERSQLCPPGWTGVVVLGDAGIVTVPVDRLVGVVRAAMKGVPGGAATDVARLRAELALSDILGPATLAYLDERDFVPAKPSMVVEELSATHGDVVALAASVSAEDVDESGVEEIMSSAFVVRVASEVVAVAGYRHWPSSVAHVSVLTAAGHRGRGFATVVASAAVADALESRLLPQWRARSTASRRVAMSLGFRELGAQLSIRLAA